MEIQAAIRQLLDRDNLARPEMRQIMMQVMSGKVSDIQAAGFLVALRAKGESAEEITAAVEVLRDQALKIQVSGAHLIDTCGTGGDGASTFNISTTAAFVVAAAGGQVAKHGNRSISSRCGSADVLEALGVNLALTPRQVKRCIEEIGVGFLYAPQYHGAMKHVAVVRRQLGVRTLFNLLGPLLNPASAPCQLLGVFDSHYVEPLAQVLKNLGSRHVLVVHAEDGLDEISLASPTRVAELQAGQIRTYQVTPEQFGFERTSLAALKADCVEKSKEIMLSVLSGTPGPARDIVALNAGAAIYAAELCESLGQGVAKAEEILSTGIARQRLTALIEWTQAQPKLSE